MDQAGTGGGSRSGQVAAPEDGADWLARRCARARQLDEAGNSEAARDLYLAILATCPDHAPTLNGLGALLFRTGYRRAARTVFAQAVACHPGQAKGRVNLGNVLRAAGELDAARSQFEAALALSPLHPQAHQGLGDVLAEGGDGAGAARHWRLGYQGHAVHSWVFRGAGPPVRVLMPISVANGNIAARVFLDDRVFAVTTLAMEYFGPDAALPPHDVVLNAIGDADLCGDALRAAEALAARTGAVVINRPERVLETSRAAVPGLLAGIDGVVVPRVVTLARDALVGGGGEALLARHGLRLPVLLRAPGFHTGRHFLRIDRAQDLAPGAAALPGPELLAIAYCDARWADGLARKGRVMIIDGRLYPLHWAASPGWKVHYFTSGMAESAMHRAEEARFLGGMRGFLGARAADGLAVAAARLGLEYGGIDFGVGADGRVIVFEANATMAIVPPPDEPHWQYRRPAAEAAILATQTMLLDKSSYFLV